MRWLSVVCLCVVAAHLASTFPINDDSQQSPAQETLSSLEASLGKPTSEHSDREKRTIGILRRIFPELSKMIDDKIQQLTSVIFRVVGRFVLGGGALGGGGGGGGAAGGNSDGGNGRRVSITLPTYPPDEDEDETEEPDTSSDSNAEATEPSSTTENNDIPDDGVGAGRKRSVPSNKGVGNSDGYIKELSHLSVDDIMDPFRRKRDVSEVVPQESEKTEVRVPFVPKNDLKAAATGDNEEAESSNEEVSDDADEAESGEVTRNKRLGVFGNLFGGGGSAGGSSGGSGGGSGNFLFDIIRQTADGAARAAGSMYRMVVGTDDGSELLAYSNDLTVPTAEMAVAAASAPTVSTATTAARQAPPAARPTTPSKPTLVAGSGATETQDENANAPVASGDQTAPAQPADDGYQAGIPGPITRLFVIANRGVANLIQDLILRLAQTSERIVNFKARLITAII